ncbi:MAG: recombinase family protein [Halanaeroarchaeum sp.]
MASSGLTALYRRAIAPDQDPASQLDRLLAYAVRDRGIDRSNVVVVTDRRPEGGTEGLDRVEDLARGGALSRLIVTEPSRIATNMRELASRVEFFQGEHGVDVHFLEPSLVVGEADGGDAESTANLRSALRVASRLETTMRSKRAKENVATAKAAGKHVGRPPFGFDTDENGYLVPNEDFETALRVIERWEAGGSKRSIAADAGVSRTTVGNIIDRKAFYLKNRDVAVD